MKKIVLLLITFGLIVSITSCEKKTHKEKFIRIMDSLYEEVKSECKKGKLSISDLEKIQDKLIKEEGFKDRKDLEEIAKRLKGDPDVQKRVDQASEFKDCFKK